MRIYFHKSCFDGIASAALAAWLADGASGFEPVDYEQRKTWESVTLDANACVVDFLYHPQARWWWDHHATPFVTQEARAHYDARQSRFVHWDPDAPSCAGLILRKALGAREVPAHLRDLVRWADKLDSASYESPEDAVLNLTPARLISLSFAIDDSAKYHDLLIRALLREPVRDVIVRSEIHERCEEARRRYTRGIELFRREARLDRGVVLYDLIVSNEQIVDRMIPYLLYPEADYTLGVVRNGGRVKLTCNSNPWRRPQGPDLGKLLTRYGGGGHHDVASALLHGASPTMLAQAVNEIASELQQHHGPDGRERLRLAH